MLDQWSKVAVIAVAIVLIVSAVIAPSVGGIIWLARLDYDVDRVQTDVGQLQTDVGQLQTDVAQIRSDIEQLQEGQQIMIDILRELVDDVAETKADLTGHTHDSDGRARFSLDR